MAKEGEGLPIGPDGASAEPYNPLMFKGASIAIDENDAAFKVSALINEHRNELLKFDLATAKERDESTSQRLALSFLGALIEVLIVAFLPVCFCINQLEPKTIKWSFRNSRRRQQRI